MCGTLRVEATESDFTIETDNKGKEIFLRKDSCVVRVIFDHCGFKYIIKCSVGEPLKGLLLMFCAAKIGSFYVTSKFFLNFFFAGFSINL